MSALQAKTQQREGAAELLLSKLQTGMRGLAKNVPDLGAKGDGKTNDMEALAKAFARSGSAHVPPGTYVLGPNPLSIPKNVALRGSMSRIFLTQ